jgi:hypothetical protein
MAYMLKVNVCFCLEHGIPIIYFTLLIYVIHFCFQFKNILNLAIFTLLSIYEMENSKFEASPVHITLSLG